MVKRKEKKKVVKKIIETTDRVEFAELLVKGYKVVDIRSAQKGSYQAKAIPKTYVVKK